MILTPGCRVAVADGVGRPEALSRQLSEEARELGDVRLFLGWMPAEDDGLDLAAFADVRTVMGGWGLRRAIDDGRAHYLPARMGSVPALLSGPLRPDVVVVSVVEGPLGLTLGSEVSWMRAAIATGARVVGVLRPGVPACDAGDPLTGVEVLASDDGPPVLVPTPRSTPEHTCIADSIAALLPDGARLQIGPGPLGAAVLAAIRRPVTIDSGMITDAVAVLDAAGLMTGLTMATYLSGTEVLYDWADGRRVLRGAETTHHPGRLIDTPGPFVAVNTALEIDHDGAVNVEGIPTSTVGGLGGHPDYSAAASASTGGLSVIAAPTHHGGRPLLVSRLSCPPSTASHDVDIIVTERGHIDLRGLDRTERRHSIERHWG
jgi:acyl-CoA hydrolase